MGQPHFVISAIVFLVAMVPYSSNISAKEGETIDELLQPYPHLMLQSIGNPLLPIFKRDQDITPQANNDIISISLKTTSSEAKELGLNEVLRHKSHRLIARSRLAKPSTPTPDRESFAKTVQKFSALIFRGPGDNPLFRGYDYATQLWAHATSLELDGQDEIKRIDRNSLDFKDFQRVDTERVRKYLPDNGVLVEWFRYSEWDAPHYAAYVLKPTGEVMAYDLGKARPIDALVKKFRESLNEGDNVLIGDGVLYRKLAKQLFDKLIAPLHIHLSKNEKLLLSPDGGLNLLPFAALVDEDNRYLIQRFEITYLTSGSDLIHMTNKTIARDGPVVMAGPDYGQRTSRAVPAASDLAVTLPPMLMDLIGITFSPLDGVTAEGIALGHSLDLDNAHLVLGSKATETRIRELHGPKILHLATHGFFLPDKKPMKRSSIPGKDTLDSFLEMLVGSPMLNSGLALAGANSRNSGSDDDGILTAAEVATLDLAGTQLVVLSACDTGVGQVRDGEGVIGLRRAVAVAGAETQVVSLWKVKDEATTSLMLDYYKRLYKGEGRSEALRSAQLEMMAKSPQQHPFFWASFLPIGDWKPLY